MDNRLIKFTLFGGVGMAQASEVYKRIYVNVDVRFDSSGRMIPHMLT